MANKYWCLSLTVLLFSLFVIGSESYSELMDQAEKLTEKRYDRNSRAYKIKAQELDDILNSKEPREQKIKRLQAFIREFQSQEKPRTSDQKDAIRLKQLKESAENGDPESLYQLGLLFWEGQKQPGSLGKALHYFTLAAARNHLPSKFKLALANLLGKGVIPDPKKAFSEFLALYEKGFKEAGIPLGILYYEGQGTEKNYRKAADFLQRGLAEKVSVPRELHPDAVLGRIYYFGGYGVKTDHSLAFKYLSQCQKHPSEQYLLGFLYRDGKGCSKNPAAAAECFRFAAEHGHNLAGIELGWMYYMGTGVKKDDRKAVQYLNPAVELDKLPEAAFHLAEIYGDKKSQVFDADKAFQNYRIAARAGNTEAQYRIGNMLLNGIGTAKEPKAALDYLQSVAQRGHSGAAFLCGEIERKAGHPEKSLAFYRQAADAGHIGGIRVFSDMALNGKGMKADPQLAIRYLEKLKEKADKNDLELLASLFESGIGPVKPDLEKAIRYYTLASRKGSTRSFTRLALIYQAQGKQEQAMDYAKKGAEAKDPEAIRILVEHKQDMENQKNTLRYLRQLADSGDRNAMRQYGIHQFQHGNMNDAEKYLKVFETEKDSEVLFILGQIAYEKQNYKRALELFNRSSDFGNVNALLAIGQMYHLGKGVRQDFRQAFNYYRMAGEKKEPEGMFQVGLMYYNAEGTSPDYGEACRWFRMAADLGHVLAMQYLSVMYKEGIGVPKNNIEAAKWRKKAAGLKP